MCCEEQVLMEQKLAKVIEDHKDMQGALIPVLHEAQAIYGYLPYDVMRKIADGLGIPVAKVYGVVTFYSQFSLDKKGKYRINVCMGTACYVKGSADILNKFREELGIEIDECTEDGMFSLESCRCVGACGLAPVVMVNDDVYGKLVPEDVVGIIKKYAEAEEASK